MLTKALHQGLTTAKSHKPWMRVLWCGKFRLDISFLYIKSFFITIKQIKNVFLIYFMFYTHVYYHSISRFNVASHFSQEFTVSYSIHLNPFLLCTKPICIPKLLVVFNVASHSSQKLFLSNQQTTVTSKPWTNYLGSFLNHKHNIKSIVIVLLLKQAFTIYITLLTFNQILIIS